MTAGEDKKWIEDCYRKFYVRVVARLPSVATGPLPGSIPKRTVVEAVVETTAAVVQPTPTVADLPPHLDPTLTAEQLNLIYMRAGAFPAGEDLQSIYRLRGLLRCDKWKKQAFCSVFFKDSYKLSTLDTHGRKHEEKEVWVNAILRMKRTMRKQTLARTDLL